MESRKEKAPLHRDIAEQAEKAGPLPVHAVEAERELQSKAPGGSRRQAAFSVHREHRTVRRKQAKGKKPQEPMKQSKMKD